MKILFMGTPEFAVASLKALVEAGQRLLRSARLHGAVELAPVSPASRFGLQ